MTLTIMRQGALALLLMAVFAVNAGAEDYGATARGMFALLPPSIFESTTTGLTDAEKQELLSEGRTGDWELAEETPDRLAIYDLPFREKAIGVQVFRNYEDGSTDVAIGTLSDPICSLEMWRMDVSGRIVPIDTPHEPEIGEFFDHGHKLSQRIKYAVQVCLVKGALKAVPIFWNELGMLPAKLENEIFYEWTGRDFKKMPRSTLVATPSR